MQWKRRTIGSQRQIGKPFIVIRAGKLKTALPKVTGKRVLPLSVSDDIILKEVRERDTATILWKRLNTKWGGRFSFSEVKNSLTKLYHQGYISKAGTKPFNIHVISKKPKRPSSSRVWGFHDPSAYSKAESARSYTRMGVSQKMAPDPHVAFLYSTDRRIGERKITQYF